MGGIDNKILEFDLKMMKFKLDYLGHADSITDLKVSHEGSFLLSTSFDNSMRLWDIRDNKIS